MWILLVYLITSAHASCAFNDALAAKAASEMVSTYQCKPMQTYTGIIELLDQTRACSDSMQLGASPSDLCDKLDLSHVISILPTSWKCSIGASGFSLKLALKNACPRL